MKLDSKQPRDLYAFFKLRNYWQNLIGFDTKCQSQRQKSVTSTREGDDQYLDYSS